MVCGQDSLRGLGQKAYKVLAAHGRLETSGGIRSAACHSECSLVGREGMVCQLDGTGAVGGVERRVQCDGCWAPMKMFAVSLRGRFFAVDNALKEGLYREEMAEGWKKTSQGLESWFA